MRILVDTNVIILREDHHKLYPKTTNFYKYASQSGYKIVVHPIQEEDFKRDSKKDRRNISISKLECYESLEFKEDPLKDIDFLQKIGLPKSENDKVDNFLLYALYRRAVEFLVTEDLEIHKKGEKLNLQDSIFTIEDAADFLEDKIEKKISSPYFIDNIEWADLDISDPFFDSLKKDYEEFEEWFNKNAPKGRKGWIYRPNQLEAILLWKRENEIVQELLTSEKRLRIKICTMKVVKRGYKIGELFLQLIFELARVNSIFEIYVSAYQNKKSLIFLLQQFGFQIKGINKRGEIYLQKFLKPTIELDPDWKNYTNLNFSRLYYPSLRLDKCGIYTIPIKPKFIYKLFGRFDMKQKRLTNVITKDQIPGNSIKKAYLSSKIINVLNAGDILTFYRSERNQGIFSIGIVEECYSNVKSVSKVRSYAGKRTVYTDTEISDMIKEHPDGISVILFRHHFYFDSIIPKKEAIDKKILKSHPQAFQTTYNPEIMRKVIKERIHDSNHFIY